jgi:pimeloyl-ACP methyl ester carboxylesterase
MIPLDIELTSYEIVVAEEPRVALAVIEAGPSNPRETIVFVHGFGGWKEQWLPQIRCFSAQARVLALDLRGHGSSSKPRSDYSVSELLHDLEVAVEQLSVQKPFVLVGHSFGAALVASYAAEHPDEIEKLVLISPSSDYTLSWIYRWGFYIPDAVFDAVMGIINRIRPTFLAPAYVLKALYFNALSVWDAEEVLPHVRAPTLVIRPRWDPLFSPRDVRRVIELLPTSEEAVIPSLMHLLMTAHPRAVNDALEAFLGLPCGKDSGSH